MAIGGPSVSSRSQLPEHRAVLELGAGTLLQAGLTRNGPDTIRTNEGLVSLGMKAWPPRTADPGRLAGLSVGCCNPAKDPQRSGAEALVRLLGGLLRGR